MAKYVKESVIESYLREKVKTLGGVAYKFVSPGRRGVPDRICCFPGGTVVFVEVKSPTGTTTPIQDVEIKTLKQLGFDAVIIDSRPRVDALLRWVVEREKKRQALKSLIKEVLLK